MPESPCEPWNNAHLMLHDDDDQYIQENDDSARFEDWFENDIHSDSADEETEENIVIIDDPSHHNHPELFPDQNLATGNDDVSDGSCAAENLPSSSSFCFRDGFHGDVMIPKLLDEAMRDEVIGPVEVFKPSLPSADHVRETLTNDEHLFERDKISGID